uniref:RUN domain-containing protein n=1 Tax=Schistocephalus solidus TaxID=70667 RepID=A0A0X3PK80_SCHSO
MPLSDQRLKDLKACILAFHQNPSQPIDDRHPILINFFSTLERIFRYGLKTGTSRVGLTKWHLWNWIEKLPSYTSDSGLCIPYLLLKAIDETKKSSRVTTAQGKDRLFLRTLVQRKLLESFLQLLRDNPVFVLRHYEADHCLFTDEILSEILRSLFAELARLELHLDLDNADFLDETWELSVMKELQFVPCRRLGLGVQICGKHFVVTDIKPYSFVLDEDSIELGDVISEFLGRPLHGTSLDLKQLHVQNGLRPITMKIVKLRLPSGLLYQPLVAVLSKSNLEKLVIRAKSPSAGIVLLFDNFVLF